MTQLTSPPTPLEREDPDRASLLKAIIVADFPTFYNAYGEWIKRGFAQEDQESSGQQADPSPSDA